MTEIRNTFNPKWKRYDRWLIRRDGFSKHKPWRADGPFEPSSDYHEVEYFATHAEAVEYAVRSKTRDRLIQQFEEYLDAVQNDWMPKEDQRIGLDTMFRMLRWWGKLDLAGILENV